MLKWFRRPRSVALSEDTLITAQRHFFDREAALTIVDAGAHEGQTTLQYLLAFPRCRVIALEPDPANHAAAANTLSGYDRVELLKLGLSDRPGMVPLRLTSHSGAHSLLEVGDMRHFDVQVDVLAPIQIEVTSLDRLCSDRAVNALDVLKMDIQGAELLALKGARDLLKRRAISFVVLEVSFQPLYKNQPTFWDIADHLRGHDYALQGLYEHQHHKENHAILRWADAIFAAPNTMGLPR
jgi:FkbM family methyltransferase